MEWLQTLVFIIGLGGLLGGLFASFWASRSKGLQELLRTENAAYKESNERLHDENKQLRQEMATCQAELKVWRDNVTQRPNIEKLIAATAKQHVKYMVVMGKVADSVATLTQQVIKLQGGKDGQ